MASIFDLLQSQMSDDVIGALTNQLGAEKKQTSTAVDNGMAILMKALAKNSSNSSGADALGAALDRDHDGSLLNDLTGFIQGNASANNSKAANGAGILGHLLGGQQGGVIDALAKSSGLNSNQSSSLLVKLAPIVLGMLGKQKKSSGLSNSDLSSVLSGALGQATQKASNPSILTSLLDRDGDGSIADEAASLGMNLLKGLFKK